MTKMFLTGALVAALLLTLPVATSADSGHEKMEAGASEGDHSAGSEHHEGSMAESADLPNAWRALMAARDAIAGDVEAGALDDVHEKAEPLPGLVAALIEQSGDLEASKRTRVEGAGKQVTRVADALHMAADGGDAARTRKELSRLDGLLELIQAQYPAGALDAGMHDTDGHSAAPDDAHGMHAHMELPAGVVDTKPQAAVRIQAFDRLRFEPNRIEVQVGVPTRIELENSGAADHSFVVKTPDGERDWVHLHVLPGTTKAATYQLDTPGTYPVLCTIPGHTEGGMVGELVVLGGTEHSTSFKARGRRPVGRGSDEPVPSAPVKRAG